MGVEGRSPHPRRAHNYEKRSFVVIVCYNKHALFTGAKLRKLWESTKLLGDFFENTDLINAVVGAQNPSGQLRQVRTLEVCSKG